MRGKSKVIALVLLAASLAVLGTGFAADAGEGEYVMLGGQPVGIALRAEGLIVTAVGGVTTEEGEVFPLEGSGIEAGDIVVSVGGEQADNFYAFGKSVAGAGGEIELGVLSDGERRTVKVTPAREAASGKKRLGLVLKEDVGGIGTLTFVTERGAYAALGHTVADGETGLSSELSRGAVYPTTVEGVIKSESGKAGGLSAAVNRLRPPLGRNFLNTPIGIYGAAEVGAGRRIRVAERGEAHPGRAQVITTLSGSVPEAYDVDIVKSVTQHEKAEKGLVIKVRDRELLQKAGGIVQGMSGSPIVQDGLLVGAVTHVFVSDPTRGYGVHARFMLEEAENAADMFAAGGREAA